MKANPLDSYETGRRLYPLHYDEQFADEWENGPVGIETLVAEGPIKLKRLPETASSSY